MVLKVREERHNIQSVNLINSRIFIQTIVVDSGFLLSEITINDKLLYYNTLFNIATLLKSNKYNTFINRKIPNIIPEKCRTKIPNYAEYTFKV